MKVGFIGFSSSGALEGVLASRSWRSGLEILEVSGLRLWAQA